MQLRTNTGTDTVQTILGFTTAQRFSSVSSAREQHCQYADAQRTRAESSRDSARYLPPDRESSSQTGTRPGPALRRFTSVSTVALFPGQQHQAETAAPDRASVTTCHDRSAAELGRGSSVNWGGAAALGRRSNANARRVESSAQQGKQRLCHMTATQTGTAGTPGWNRSSRPP
jgi:hypothetical protein